MRLAILILTLTLAYAMFAASGRAQPPGPAFSPPPGWTRVPPENLPSPAPFAAWSGPLSTIQLTIQSTPMSLSQLHASALAAAKADKANSNILDEAVRACNGKQDGRLFGFQHTDSRGVSSERIGIFTVTKGRQYAALYVSSRVGLPDAGVMASLLSLCAP